MSRPARSSTRFNCSCQSAASPCRPGPHSPKPSTMPPSGSEKSVSSQLVTKAPRFGRYKKSSGSAEKPVTMVLGQVAQRRGPAIVARRRAGKTHIPRVEHVRVVGRHVPTVGKHALGLDGPHLVHRRIAASTPAIGVLDVHQVPVPGRLVQVAGRDRWSRAGTSPRADSRHPSRWPNRRRSTGRAAHGRTASR